MSEMTDCCYIQLPETVSYLVKKLYLCHPSDRGIKMSNPVQECNNIADPYRHCFSIGLFREIIHNDCKLMMRGYEMLTHSPSIDSFNSCNTYKLLWMCVYFDNFLFVWTDDNTSRNRVKSRILRYVFTCSQCTISYKLILCVAHVRMQQIIILLN